MKLSLSPIMLAISVALAAPANFKRANTLEITNLYANTASVGDSAYIDFFLKDAQYPRDTPTECNVIWQYGEQPPLNARCQNGAYYIKFPEGPVNFDHFTLALQRVNGTIPEKGQAVLDSNANGNAPASKWSCRKNAREGVNLACSYDGTLRINV
ncbi:hypothetical protein N7468_006213 [Penicillium chermesinum]|uniref:AA1-like domain-containing protein n=1 Tax=Penicillium chermesinum TaxID=63820 RepID=A0A9W9TJG0_9EURO|nr:uncharacterized protein N7468_006213 [Penicillium chermesinum]KAJ5224988.1 hypothetical protein N7468_006213 [Penicillium chermesinum]KAJ6151717.1 hypothetical protein N7470_006845 [Penicillium chermesinum]